MKEYKLVKLDGNAGVQENAGIAQGGIPDDLDGLAGNPVETIGGNNAQFGDISGNVFKTFGTDEQTGKIVEQAAPASKVFGEVTLNEAGNPELLPKKVGLWGKIKNFLFQEIDLRQEVVIELTPKEKKVLQEVHDFWFQEVKLSSVKDFLFQEINLFGRKK